jgi:hypothetical protein
MEASIFCSSTALRLLIGQGNAQSFVIEDFHSEELPEGLMINGIIVSPDALAAFLGEMNQQWGPFRQNCTLVVENNAIRTKRVEVPNVREGQRLQYVREELSSLIEDGSDDVVDYSELGINPETGALSVLGVVAGKVQLEGYVAAVRGAGFNLKRIDVGVNALSKVGRLFPELSQGYRMLSIVDCNIATFTLYHDGEHQITRRHRLLAPGDTDERRAEVAGYLSAMLQFQKSQRNELETDSLHIAGIHSDRIQRFIKSAEYIGIPMMELQVPPTLELRGQAAFNAANFELGANLHNIGGLIRK